MKLQALGIDLGKTVFHLVGVDLSGRVMIRKRCSRTQLLAFTVNFQVQLIGMEACSGAHFWGGRCAIDAGAIREALRTDEQE